MKNTILKIVFLSLIVLLPQPGCEGQEAQGDNLTNPFLDDMSNPGKEDTAYVNPDGFEVEVDLEGDVEASSYRIFDAPAEVGQYALTYLRNRREFYLESLAEDATSDRRVEWLVDGTWMTAEQARTAPVESLRHFRIKGINAVLLNEASSGVTEGTVFTAKAPIKPYSTMTDGGEKCADPDGHISLDQSVYWYLWNPDKQGCDIPMQDLKITVSKMLPSGKVTYPEYDRLVQDGKITMVILFGQIDDELTDSDPGMRNMKRLASWLKEGGFTEQTPAQVPKGKRFSKTVSGVEVIVDLYSPYDFGGLGDMGNFSNFQKALSEHEIVAYDGHSMLGASDFWSRPDYPDFYQIYLYGGCLGYEYYVRPILAGKGGWENVDIVSSVVEVSADANYYATPVLAKIMWALGNSYGASWKDILVEIRKRVYDSTFGASGVRENCFSPNGPICTPDTPTGDTRTYQSTNPVPVPDNNPSGVTSVITVPETITAKSVTVDLDVSHTWVGDLRIILAHDGTEAILWDKAGGSQQNITGNFPAVAFAGKPAAGDWTLKLIDTAARDSGTLNLWKLNVEVQP